MENLSLWFPFCVLDSESFLIKEVNKAFCDILGYDNSVIGQEYLALVVSEEFSFVLQVLTSLGDSPFYVTFSLLAKDGNPRLLTHALFRKENTIVDAMIPTMIQDKIQLEHMVLKKLVKPVFCLALDGTISYANESAQKLFSHSSVSLNHLSQWEEIKKQLMVGKPFSQWLIINQKEGFFFFHPMEDRCWLVEYQWGREEILGRLSEIIQMWEVPAIVIDFHQGVFRGSVGNKAIASFHISPLELFSRIQKIQNTGGILSILSKEGGFVYYRVLFFPFHPSSEIMLVVFEEETDHVKNTFTLERLRSALCDMIQLSEDIQRRLSGGMEAFFEHYHLSERERKLVQFIQQGFSNEEIASSLYVSVDTVKKNISQLYRKLEVGNRLELLQLIYFPVRSKTPLKG